MSSGIEGALEVHPVVLDAVGLHGLERAEPDVERHADDRDAARGRLREHGLREVEARRRRGDRAGLAREHRLVVEPVLRVGDAAGAVDVGRQGSGTQGGKGVEKIFFAPVLREAESVEAAFCARRSGIEDFLRR